MNRNKHIWEGWTVGNFIDELEPIFNIIQSNFRGFRTTSFESKQDVRNWVKDNQPYYKKHIPEVANYFINKWENE
jgi:uncharacterized protein (DUF2461 family)